MKRKIFIPIGILAISLCFSGCMESSSTTQTLSSNINSSTSTASQIIENQPAPSDLDYSLERYNLVRRAYWVNGQREKANTLPCELDKPLGYIILFSGNGSVIGKFVVDGKITSLGSYLFPSNVDQDSYGNGVGDVTWRDASVYSVENPGIDGAYGSNIDGIFFFTPDGKYIEWTGDFLYSDIPFEVEEPVLKIGGNKK